MFSTYSIIFSAKSHLLVYNDISAKVSSQCTGIFFKYANNLVRERSSEWIKSLVNNYPCCVNSCYVHITNRQQFSVVYRLMDHSNEGKMCNIA